MRDAEDPPHARCSGSQCNPVDSLVHDVMVPNGIQWITNGVMHWIQMESS